MVQRLGGGLPLDDGRVGFPITGHPSIAWVAALKRALADEHPDDEKWQRAVGTATVDEAKGVLHIAFATLDLSSADFVVAYFSAVDAAINAANRAPR